MPTNMPGNIPANGIILFSHGSRDPLWRAPIEAVRTHMLSMQADALVACAYLELCEPDLPTVSDALVEKGVTHLTVVPMFLGTGKHAREDLPVLIEAIRTKYPHVVVNVQVAVGENPRMTALMASIALGIDTE
jgi:sirohydrochlorin cobaltochelatase